MVSLLEVGAAERLQDGGLPRLQRQAALEQDGRRAGVVLGEQAGAALEKVIGAVAPVGIHRPLGQAARSTCFRRRFSVRPGMRPRFATGLPSISLRSPVKSMGLASLIAEPTANQSIAAPVSLKKAIRSASMPPETTIFTPGCPAWSSRARTSLTRSGVTLPRSEGVSRR